MKRTTWLRKTVWIAFIALLVLAGTGLLVLRSYLSSPDAVRQIAERLQEMLGGQVVIQSARIGLIGNSSVYGIEVYEDGKTDKPWLRIDDVTVDVSALSVLLGRSPEDIHLQGARLHLRFDSDGRLLTKLPAKKEGAAEPVPSLHLSGGELTFDQQHRSPMIIRGVQAEISSGKNGPTLTGTVSDPFWGDWKANGEFNSSGSQGSITLATESVAVTMTKMRSIPFVPPSVWQEVHVEGTTPAQLRLDMETKGDKTSVHYRAEAAPRDGRVQVPSIELAATQVNGKVIVADEIVEFENVRGKTAGGSILTSGKLNFHDEPTRLVFKAGVQDVVLHDLPRSWNVPQDIDGKLTGSADLVVTIKNGKLETEGSGAGLIRDANWGGLAVDKPVGLTLHSEDGHFRFHQPGTASPAVGKKVEVQTRANYPKPAPVPNAVAANLPKQQNPEKGKKGQKDEGDLFQNAPAELVNLLGRGIKLAADGLSKGIDAAANALSKIKPPSKPGEEPTYLDVDLNLQNVDLAQLVQKLKLNLPYAITGRLTFQVHASIPINTAGDLRAYRLRGEAKLASLNVSGLAMTNVEANVRYRNGVLDLENLRGQILAGKFDGNARIDVVPRGDLQASLNLNRLPLATVLSLVPAIKGQVGGVVSGMVQARAPLMQLSDPASWRGAANFNVPSIEVFGVPLSNAVVSLLVDDKRARLSTFKAELVGAPLTGQGEVQFQGAYPFQAEVHLDRGNLTSLNRLAPAFRPPFQLTGQTQLDGTAKGTLKPLQFDTNGRLSARNLVVERFTVDDVSFRWSKDNNDMKLDAIKMELYGGSVSGSARLPLAATAPGSANLDIHDLDVKAMEKALPAFPVRLEGKISGTVKGTLSAAEGDRPRTWTSDLEVTAPQLRVQGVPAEKLKGTIDTRAGKTTYNLQGETLGGTFTIKGDLPIPQTEEGKKQSHNSDAKNPLCSRCSRSQTLFGNAVRETPFRILPRTWVGRSETEFRQMGSQTEFGNQKENPHFSRSQVFSRSQTLFGNAVRETRFRILPRTWVGRSETEFRQEGSQTEFGNQKERRDIPARSASDGPDHPSLALRACAFIADEPGGSGRFELHNARLSRVWRVFDIAGPLASLNGRFSIFINYRHIGPRLSPIGNGTFQIVNIRWYDEFLGANLQGNVRLTTSALELLNISGDIAAGQFLGQVVFGLRPSSRSWFQINLQQVESSRLLIPLPAVAAHVKGPVDVDLHGNIGRDWDGSGGVTLVRTLIYGMEITEWRLPLTFSFSPMQGSGELAIRDSHARLGQGRARFECTLNWGNGLRLIGQLLFYDVDLRTLLRSAPEVGSYASGRLSGRVNLAGNEMRSLNDLTALVQVKMKQGQALQLPVLRQIVPYLRPRAQSATFQSGELKGRLAGGIFRIEHASLVGDFIKMLILGTINLAGNLNLEVTAQTGLYSAQTNSISSRIPIVGAIPRLILYEASTLLAAAVVHLRVTGTVSAPVVRIEPLVTLTDEVVRFFLGTPLRIAIPDLP